MCLIEDVDALLVKVFILWRKYKSIYEIWFCLINQAQFGWLLWVELRANLMNAAHFTSCRPRPHLLRPAGKNWRRENTGAFQEMGLTSFTNYELTI